MYAMKALDRGSRQARMERIGRRDRMSEVASFTVASVERKILLDRTNSMELVVSGFGGLTDEVLHGQCAVEKNAKAFDSVRKRDCSIAKLKGVDRNRGVFVLFR